MRPQIPSTQELRAFEAVARYLSCTRAARELLLTTSAVSKQLHSLEESLGVELFIRGKHGLLLSEAGQTYLECIKPILSKLAEAGARVTCQPLHQQHLHVRVAPAFADRWLFPRYPEFSEANPELTVRFDTSLETDETISHAFDAYIRFGQGVWPGCEADYLCGRQLILVANPNLLRRNPPIQTPEDLVNFPLLEHSQVRHVWTQAFQTLGCQPVKTPYFVPCDFYSVVIRSVCVGLGLALVPRCFVTDELQDGDLVQVLNYSQRSPYGYYLVIPEARKNNASVLQFRTWLRSKKSDGEDPRV